MSQRTYRTFQALILAALGIFLLSKVWDGSILFYINQRFVIFVLLAGLGLIVLSQIVLRSRPPVQADEEDTVDDYGDQDYIDHNPNERQGWMLWLLALPILIGILIPEHSLESNIRENPVINPNAGIVVSGSEPWAVPQILSKQRFVFDWHQSFYNQRETSNDIADVTGFIDHNSRMSQDQLTVSRFAFTCCVVDASAFLWVSPCDLFCPPCF